MKTQIYIDNLKCGGCASTITKELSALKGVNHVKVDNDADLVEVDTEENVDLLLIKTKLKSLGYPEKDTVHGFEKLTTGAKSYVSCAIGRIHKDDTLTNN
ncbi:MAG: heavy-metal-associated domain-containing protein [Bacteroidia bacterium]|nr:heavy-metal-associated domain-containing protein [Bacteroidia bacterium]